MHIDDAEPGTLAIIQRCSLSERRRGQAPEGSPGYGEKIVVTVTARCNGKNAGKVRILFRNPFRLGATGRKLTDRDIVDPCALLPITPESMKDAFTG